MQSGKIRGFEILPGYEANEHVRIPQRATKQCAGYDLCTAADIEIEPGQIGMVETGLTAYMLPDEWLGLYSRSSTPKKYELMLANGVGVIDSDYYGQPIKIMLRNIGREKISLKAGDRLAQGVFQKYLLTDGDQTQEERSGGFGSTGE